jgi:hypothetical protein
MIKAEAEAGIYRPMCSQQWKPKSTNLVVLKNLDTWSMNPSYRWELTEPRYAYHKPFMLKFPDKFEWERSFELVIKCGLIWYTDWSKTNKGTVTGGVEMGLEKLA